MPAGRISSCETCYWRGLLDKRVRIDQAAFASPAFALLFTNFGAWLQQHAGAKRAASRIHRYLPFFAEIERRWGRIPDYSDLLKYFGAEGLRRVRLPMKWLGETHGIAVDAVAREIDSERRRVDEIIATIPAGTVAANALAAYRIRLQAKIDAGRSTIRSMRLALRPAANLLLAADASGHTLPEQDVLEDVLCHTPGQLAALTGFIRFLNQLYALNLAAAVDVSLVAERRRRRLEATLLSLAENGDGSDVFLRKWIEIGLAYFHGLPMKAGNHVSTDDIGVDVDGYRVSIDNQEYWLPSWRALALPVGGTGLAA